MGNFFRTMFTQWYYTRLSRMNIDQMATLSLNIPPVSFQETLQFRELHKERGLIADTNIT